MRIRLMKRADIPGVANLLVESYKKEDKSMRWNHEYAEKYVTMLYRLCKDLCFVVISKDKVIACAASVVMPEYDKNVVDSKILLVHPEYRKQGLGKKLIRKTCLKADAKYNIQEIETNIYTLTNFPITWYESIGFRTKKHYEVTRAKIQNVINKI
ncbi:MAG: GNAT family N-acetyltransferase [Clostridia bacterium]|nr:GNAT family N-acetyltransferase [Clostridia bacterium]